MKKIFYYNKPLTKMRLGLGYSSIINITAREEFTVIKTNGDVTNILINLINAMNHIIREKGDINFVQEIIKSLEGHYFDNK